MFIDLLVYYTLWNEKESLEMNTILISPFFLKLFRPENHFNAFSDISSPHTKIGLLRCHYVPKCCSSAVKKLVKNPSVFNFMNQFPEKKGKPPAYQQLKAAVPVFKLTLIEATPMQACGIMVAADRKTLCPASCLTQAIRKLSKRQ